MTRYIEAALIDYFQLAKQYSIIDDFAECDAHITIRIGPFSHTLTHKQAAHFIEGIMQEHSGLMASLHDLSRDQAA